MLDERRLKILTEGARFDVSCSSSGSGRKNPGGMGNGYPAGCCHSFTPDGRCVSLLKILLSNDCIFSCKYCMNRSDLDIPRASASPEEIAELTADFYKRNYIEGLFLSSAIVKSPNETMERLVRTVKLLRIKYRFHGYIHVKEIPYADEGLIFEAAKYADRMSSNIELPSEKSLKLLAPQKSKQSLLLPMKQLENGRQLVKAERKKELFLPAGQTTQMIVGASPERDGQIVRLTQALYRGMNLRRVYFSSYVPLVQDSLLPDLPAGQLREHRLYQADWLLRFYGFSAEEIVPENEDLAPDLDPKCAWALRNLQYFPVEVNRAPLELLLRVPGIGGKSAKKILEARKYTTLRPEHLKKMRVVLKRARHFITVGGVYAGAKDFRQVRGLLAAAETGENARQMSFFDGENGQFRLPGGKAEENFRLYGTKETALSALTGEL